MIRCGSTVTMEAWDKTFKPNLDWNHAWGAAPANAIPRWVAGVQPLTPGCGKVLVCPHLGHLTSVETLVPTPHGGIACRYRQHPGESLEAVISIPEKVEALLMLPCPGKGCKLAINGKTLRKFKVRNGRTALNLKSGDWEISIKPVQ